MAIYYVSWQYGDDSNDGAAATPIASLAAADALIADGDSIVFQKSEKPMVLDSAGSAAYLKFTNASDEVVIYTGASIDAGSPNTDTGFSSPWDTSTNTHALDFIASQYDFDFPEQPYSQSIWFGVKSISGATITLNDDWYSPVIGLTEITAKAVWASGSYDVSNSNNQAYSDTLAFKSADEEWGLFGGYTYDGDETWTAPADTVDDESVVRNTYEFTNYNNQRGTAINASNEYNIHVERFTLFNYKYGFYMSGVYTGRLRKGKTSACTYPNYYQNTKNFLTENCINAHFIYYAYSMNYNDNNTFNDVININQFYTSTNRNYGAYMGFCSYLHFKNWIHSGVYIGSFNFSDTTDVMIDRPSFPNPYSGGTAYQYSPWRFSNYPPGGNIVVYKPSGFENNPAGSTYGRFAATAPYQYRTSTHYKYINPTQQVLSITSGSSDEYEVTYFHHFDYAQGNDDEIGWYEKSGSGVDSTGNAIAFYPKLKTTYSYGGEKIVGGVLSAPGVKEPLGGVNGLYGGNITDRCLDLVVKFPVESGKKVKVTFQAKKDGSFSGHMFQSFTGNGNRATGSVSESILTTSWTEYSTTSPPVETNTILECHFLVSGSAGQAAVDHISASFI